MLKKSAGFVLARHCRAHHLAGVHRTWRSLCFASWTSLRPSWTAFWTSCECFYLCLYTERVAISRLLEWFFNGSP